MNIDFFMPTRIVFGAGRLEELGTAIDLPGKKALIVIGAGGSMRRLGYLERVVKLLEKNGVKSVVFDKVLPNPVLAHVDEGAEFCRANNCDFVLGLGGGSPIDSAKAIAVGAPNPGSYWDYVAGGSGGGKPIPNGVLPIVAVTTTAGTGTEADPWLVITNPDTEEKVGYGNKYTFPVISIIDPELMLSVPPSLTAYQGMDAFFHSVEGYISVKHQSVSDPFALEAVRLVTKYLPLAVKNGNDLDARTQVAWANTQAGFVESLSSNTAHHSMEHAVSAFYPEVAHGAGLILTSVEFFTYVAERAPERFPALAEAMGMDLSGMNDTEKPFAFITALKKLISDIGLSDLSFSSYGITKKDSMRFAEKSFSSMARLFTLTPHKFTVDEVKEVFDRAIGD